MSEVNNLETIKLKPEYMGWVAEGKKTATTRRSHYPLGRHFLVSSEDDGTKPIEIEIDSIMSWSADDNLAFSEQFAIAKAEGFRNWQSFQDALVNIYGRTAYQRSTFYTHFFKVI